MRASACDVAPLRIVVTTFTSIVLLAACSEAPLPTHADLVEYAKRETGPVPEPDAGLSPGQDGAPQPANELGTDAPPRADGPTRAKSDVGTAPEADADGLPAADSGGSVPDVGSPVGYTALLSRQFEQGAVQGALPQGSDAFDNAKTGLTEYDSTVLGSSGTAAKITLPAGVQESTGGGTWFVPGSLQLTSGTETWVKLDVYWEASFIWESAKRTDGGPEGDCSNLGTAGPQYQEFKLLRFDTDRGIYDFKQADGRLSLAYGAHLLTPTNGSLWNQEVPQAKNLGSVSGFEYPEPDGITARGRWHTFEIYTRWVKKGETDGAPTTRVWADGHLVWEDATQHTLLDGDTSLKRIILGRQWNGCGPVRTQSLWVDNLVLTVERPNQQDSHGNWFIGTAKPPAQP